MTTDIDAFDLNAAVLRRSEKDMRAFLAALAVRLGEALPGRVEVERKRDGLFSKTSHVARITLRTDSAVFAINFDKSGLAATRAKIVRDVVISTTPVPVPQWLTELRDAIGKMAESSGLAGDVLHGFL